MSDGKWSGNTRNRTWVRPGSRLRLVGGDAERSARLYDELAAEPFLCDACGRMHALSEHRGCRETGPVSASMVARLLLAAVAFMVVVAGIAWLGAHSWWVTP